MIQSKFSWVLFSLILIVSEANARLPLSEGVRVIDPSKKYVKVLGENPDLVIDHVNSQGFEVFGPKGLTQFLDKMGIFFVPAEEPSKKLLASYPSPEASIGKMQALQRKYPDLITLIEIGKSVEGRPLLFARLTAPANLGSALQTRPEFKYIANMHGDEIVGREMMVSLIEDLASKYNKDTRVTQLLNHIQVYILPSMNPDGAFHQVRYNAHGIDLNRSFPDWTTSDNQNNANRREPEIQAVMAFQAAHQFKLSANFHGGSQVVNYPWDAIADLFPLDNLVKKLSLNYARNATYIYNSTEFKQGITNGFAWYMVKGGMQDWSYHWHNDLQVTIELTNTKWPEYSVVGQTYQANRESLIGYVEAVLDL
jgi:hypothetical protein